MVTMSKEAQLLFQVGPVYLAMREQKEFQSELNCRILTAKMRHESRLVPHNLALEAARQRGGVS